jgi:hypothetical protein
VGVDVDRNPAEIRFRPLGVVHALSTAGRGLCRQRNGSRALIVFFVKVGAGEAHAVAV